MEFDQTEHRSTCHAEKVNCYAASRRGRKQSPDVRSPERMQQPRNVGNTAQ